ncbi:unnamed protein product [Clonostachys solani]|uniref:C2H2-type domain-containing protein n=1 Tax=Clonostachys solani TaxID=160281 RepID=A0A9N9ZBH5_9HYPO|nr:unnamed protein product [Clonostachys solani]
MAREPSALHPEELLLYDDEYQVVVCQQCKYALRGTAIDRHLKEVHKILRSSRHPYMAYVSKFPLLEPEEVITKPMNDFPVPFLPVFDGLKCLDSSCSYLCISTKRMQKHWLSEHGRHGYDNKDWQPALLQTFFRGNSLRYFTGPSKEPTCGGNQVVTSYGSPQMIQTLNDGHLTPSKDELLQHFQTSTSNTIVRGEEDLWRHTLPQLAASHQFLMHAILACSALHLAAKHPLQQQYLICAFKHQNIAMPMFRDAVAKVTEDNCHAILGFMHLLVVYSFGAERHEDSLLLIDTSSPEPDFLLSWLYYRRNGCTLLGNYKELISSGPLKQLCRCWHLPDITTEKLPQTKDVLLVALEDLVTSLHNGGELSKEDYHAVEEAGHRLLCAFVRADNLGSDFNPWDAVCGWPMLVSLQYTRLLAQQHPVALILLGYYCLLLKKLQGHWFIGNYPLRLLYLVKGGLELRWHCYIDSLINRWEEGL